MRRKASVELSHRKSVIFGPRDATELSRFFAKNKDEYQDIWIILTKKKYVNPQPVSATEAVTEAIRHSLIDTRTKSLNQQKYLKLFQKRKNRSHWTTENLQILKQIRREEKN